MSEGTTKPDLPEQLPPNGRLIAIDWGTKRFGVALSDPNQRLAHPIGELTRRSNRRFPLNQLRPLIEQHQPVGVLVGLPLTPAGKEGESARAAREVSEIIRAKTGLPVALHDERMSSARVLSAMTDVPRKRRRSVDDLAATVMLQSYLDSRTP